MPETLDLLRDKELVASGQFLLQGGQLCDLDSSGRWRTLYTWTPERHSWLAPGGPRIRPGALELMVASDESDENRREPRSLKLTLIGDAGASFKRGSARVRFSSANGVLSLLTYEDGRSFELDRDGKLWHPLRQRERQFDRIYLQAHEWLLVTAELVVLPQPRGRLSELAERSSLLV